MNLDKFISDEDLIDGHINIRLIKNILVNIIVESYKYRSDDALEVLKDSLLILINKLKSNEEQNISPRFW
jgi:hypothetical protein